MDFPLRFGCRTGSGLFTMKTRIVWMIRRSGCRRWSWCCWPRPARTPLRGTAEATVGGMVVGTCRASLCRGKRIKRHACRGRWLRRTPVSPGQDPTRQFARPLQRHSFAREEFIVPHEGHTRGGHAGNHDGHHRFRHHQPGKYASRHHPSRYQPSGRWNAGHHHAGTIGNVNSGTTGT